MAPAAATSSRRARRRCSWTSATASSASCAPRWTTRRSTPSSSPTCTPTTASTSCRSPTRSSYAPDGRAREDPVRLMVPAGGRDQLRRIVGAWGGEELIEEAFELEEYESGAVLDVGDVRIRTPRRPALPAPHERARAERAALGRRAPHLRRRPRAGRGARRVRAGHRPAHGRGDAQGARGARPAWPHHGARGGRARPQGRRAAPRRDPRLGPHRPAPGSGPRPRPASAAR